ncbi:hypothetical protein [Halovivax gelatinilyticus]|uniref:hypothetical protein n=1 Tax=Halovivax gelatinilyticus TaxID=2961597 RepID=UPI0020CA2AAC|nr:hypothetical protein [Halovivax gelatinilyticus]
MIKRQNRRQLLVSFGAASVLSGCLESGRNNEGGDTIRSDVYLGNHTGVAYEVSVTVENVTTDTVLESETVTVPHDENQQVNFTETLDEDDIHPEISATVGFVSDPSVEESVTHGFAPTSAASFLAFIKSDAEIDLKIGQE